jgi:dTDP-4-dehydrorhamnose reductase
MKVLVLGHKGMLGHVVTRYLREQRLEVLTVDERYTAQPNDPLIRAMESSNADWIINCIGLIKQKSEDPLALIKTNALAPAHLKSALRKGQRLLHPSTDCVFSGKTGSYALDSRKDAEDIYGFSKMLGESAAEPGKVTVLRTSIIGPEMGTASGLMSWFLSESKRVNGFTNHFWNGITTLEWAMLACDLITGKERFEAPIVQVGSKTAVSKYELLCLIRDTWGHAIEILPAEAPDRVDRTLKADVLRRSIEEQLQQFKRWYAR